MGQITLSPLKYKKNELRVWMEEAMLIFESVMVELIFLESVSERELL